MDSAMRAHIRAAFVGGSERLHRLLGPSPVYPSDIGDLAILNGMLYFTAVDGWTSELWKSDGTVEGTTQVTFADEYGFGLYPKDLMTCNGRLFFLGSHTSWGYELWESDGTAEDTQQVADIRPGEEDSNVKNLTCVDNKLFFAADDGTTGEELYVYTMDGCIPLDAPYDFDVPCFKTGGARYKVRFRWAGGFQFDADMTTLAETGRGDPCVTLETDLGFEIPCLRFKGRDYRGMFEYSGKGARWRISSFELHED
jgi:ELWxxDGT repeat protein